MPIYPTFRVGLNRLELDFASREAERSRCSAGYASGKRRLNRERIKAVCEEGNGLAAIAAALGSSRMQVYRVLMGFDGPAAIGHAEFSNSKNREGTGDVERYDSSEPPREVSSLKDGKVLQIASPDLL